MFNSILDFELRQDHEYIIVDERAGKRINTKTETRTASHESSASGSSGFSLLSII